MKKWMFVFALFALTLLVFSFAVRAEETSPVNQEQLEIIEQVVEQLPLDENGEVDIDKLNSGLNMTISKAEERIAKVNVWLTENVSWLSFIFRTPVQLSWLFAFDVFYILLALNIFVMNGQIIWRFIKNKTWASLFGFVLFSILLVSGIYLRTAHVTLGVIAYLYDLLITSLWVGIIAGIVLFILFILLLIFAPEILIEIIQFGVRMYVWIMRVYMWIKNLLVALKLIDPNIKSSDGKYEVEDVEWRGRRYMYRQTDNVEILSKAVNKAFKK